MWGDVGRCGEMWGDVGRSGEGDLGKCGEIARLIADSVRGEISEGTGGLLRRERRMAAIEQSHQRRDAT